MINQKRKKKKEKKKKATNLSCRRWCASVPVRWTGYRWRWGPAMDTKNNGNQFHNSVRFHNSAISRMSVNKQKKKRKKMSRKNLRRQISQLSSEHKSQLIGPALPAECEPHLVITLLFNCYCIVFNSYYNSIAFFIDFLIRML